MGKITETVKILLIINVIFYLGSMFVIDSNQAMEWFALWYFGHPGFQFWQPLTHMFMHDLSSPFHLIFNMYALWMFGSSIEQVLGQKRFIFFYFSAGLGAALIHSLVNYYNFTLDMQAFMDLGFTSGEIQGWLNDAVIPGSYINGQGMNGLVIPEALSQDFFNSYNIPAVGASGAIYGVLVAFGMLFPNASLGLIFVPIPIKAKYFIPGLLLIDLFSGVTGFSIFGANIANWAHIGGALFGFIVMWYWKKNGMNTYN